MFLGPLRASVMFGLNDIDELQYFGLGWPFSLQLLLGLAESEISHRPGASLLGSAYRFGAVQFDLS